MVPDWGLSEKSSQILIISFVSPNVHVEILGGFHFQRHNLINLDRIGDLQNHQKTFSARSLLQFLEATAELLSYLEVSNLDLHPEDVEEAIHRWSHQPGADGASAATVFGQLSQLP